MTYSSSTKYVASDGVPAVQSYPPCHLFGDPDLLGLGIRIGFYFQYTAGILSLFTIAFSENEARQDLARNDLRNLRITFVGTSLAIWIALCIGSTGQTVIVIDWMIFMSLTLAAPIAMFFPEVIRIIALVSIRTWRQFQVKSPFSAFNEAAIAVINAVREERQVEENNRQIRRKLEMYDRLISAYYDLICLDERPTTQYWREETLGRFNEERAHFDALQQPNVPLRFSIDDVLQAYQEALGQPNTYREQAKEATENRIKAEKRYAERRWILEYTVLVLRYDSKKLLAERLTMGIMLMIWTAVVMILPWLYFKGLYRGIKSECDLKILAVFVPVSIHNRRFIAFMRAMVIISIIILLPMVFIFGIRFIIHGIIFAFPTLFKAETHPKIASLVKRLHLNPYKSSALIINPKDPLEEEGIVSTRPDGNNEESSPSRAGSNEQIRSNFGEGSETRPEETETAVTPKKNEAKEYHNFYIRCVHGFSGVVGLFSFCWMVILTEVLLGANHIDIQGWTGGQLIALLVGFTPLSTALWHMGRSVDKKSEDETRGQTNTISP